MNNPLISVLCSSFNHKRFVGYFINSLLKQTYENWELIIIDDCSSDNNVSEIKKFTDSRIHFYQQDVNSGSSIVTTRAFSLSKGDIIVDCASDDALREDYFTKLVEVFLEKPDVGVIYSSAQVIDENNNFTKVSVLKKRDRYEILKDMFYNNNCLPSPGMAVRREIYKTLLPMNFAMVQHQDYQWHVKLLLQTDCEILETPYVLYRQQLHNSKSLSTMNIGGINRYNLEIDALMNTFLSIKNLDLVRKVTGEKISEKYTTDCIPFLIGRAAINSKNYYKACWGYKTIINFFEKPGTFQLINSINGFTFKDLLKLSSSDNLFIYYSSNRIIRAMKKVYRFLRKVFGIG